MKKKEKKEGQKEIKRNKKGIFLAIFLIIINLLLVLIIVFQNKSSIHSKYMDMNVAYSIEDYDSLKDRIGIKVKDTALNSGFPEARYSDAQEVSIYMTNQEASSTADYVLNMVAQHSKLPMIIESSQIKMFDGYAKALIIIKYSGVKIPVYAEGTIWKETETSIGASISEIIILDSPMSDDFILDIKNNLLDIANTSMVKAADNLRIDKLQVTEKGLYFEGLIPTAVL